MVMLVEVMGGHGRGGGRDGCGHDILMVLVMNGRGHDSHGGHVYCGDHGSGHGRDSQGGGW